MPKKKEVIAGVPAPETPEEKTIRYRKNKQIKDNADRLKRKEELDEGHADERRLAFIADIFQTLNYSFYAISKRTDFSQQSLSWMFSVKDDCRLSQAEKLLDSVGYSLAVELKTDRNILKINTAPSTSRSISGVKVNIVGDFAKLIRRGGYKKPSIVLSCQPTARMYWLAQYIQSINLPIVELMARCEIDPTSLKYIFVKDDIKISQIYKIAKGTEGEISWKVNLKGNSK